MCGEHLVRSLTFVGLKRTLDESSSRLCARPVVRATARQITSFLLAIGEAASIRLRPRRPCCRRLRRRRCLRRRHRRRHGRQSRRRRHRGRHRRRTRSMNSALALDGTSCSLVNLDTRCKVASPYATWLQLVSASNFTRLPVDARRRHHAPMQQAVPMRALPSMSRTKGVLQGRSGLVFAVVGCG